MSGNGQRRLLCKVSPARQSLPLISMIPIFLSAPAIIPPFQRQTKLTLLHLFIYFIFLQANHFCSELHLEGEDCGSLENISPLLAPKQSRITIWQEVVRWWVSPPSRVLLCKCQNTSRPQRSSSTPEKMLCLSLEWKKYFYFLLWCFNVPYVFFCFNLYNIHNRPALEIYDPPPQNS